MVFADVSPGLGIRVALPPRASGGRQGSASPPSIADRYRDTIGFRIWGDRYFLVDKGPVLDDS